METSYKGTDKMITGIVFGVITFWLFAQAMVNVVPAVQNTNTVRKSLIERIEWRFLSFFAIKRGDENDEKRFNGNVRIT
jgi:hypothetical protein